MGKKSCEKVVEYNRYRPSTPGYTLKFCKVYYFDKINVPLTICNQRHRGQSSRLSIRIQTLYN